MKAAVVLLSGGMDSATLLHAVRRRRGMRRICALSFDYGQKHGRELRMARWQAKAAGIREHRVIDCRFLGALVAGGSALTDGAIPVPDLADLPDAEKEQPPTYVPNRNMILLALAAAFAEAQGMADVFYGAHAQDRYGYWDCTPAFVRRLNGTLALNRRDPVRLRAPFSRMRKADIVRLGLRLGVDFGHTWSCYRGGRRPCGSCPTCVDRADAFRAAGAADPLGPASRSS